MTELRASAVVYGEKDVAAPVNRAWLDAALDFLLGHGLPVREYEAKLTPTSAAALHPWPKGRDRLSAVDEGRSAYSDSTRIRRRCRIS